MKLIKKIALSLFIVNFTVLGFGYDNQNVSKSYAAEDPIYNKQRDELSYAVSDRANVVATEAYTSYASADQKAAYENAIAEGNRLLGLGDGATREQLASATAAINQAKASIKRSVGASVKRQQLEQAIENNRTSVNSANFLLENAPNTVAPVRDKLVSLLQRSEALIRQAEAILQKL